MRVALWVHALPGTTVGTGAGRWVAIKPLRRAGAGAGEGRN